MTRGLNGNACEKHGFACAEETGDFDGAHESAERIIFESVVNPLMGDGPSKTVLCLCCKSSVTISIVTYADLHSKPSARIIEFPFFVCFLGFRRIGNLLIISDGCSWFGTSHVAKHSRC